jgi:predicted secreted protein
MNGNDIIVKFNGTAIAAAKSAEITTKVDIVETASPTDGAFKDHIAGRKEWSVTVGYLVTSDAGLADLLTIGSKYTLVICGRGNNATTLSGTAILDTCRITATRGNLVQGSFQFVGCSTLS